MIAAIVMPLAYTAGIVFIVWSRWWPSRRTTRAAAATLAGMLLLAPSVDTWSGDVR